MLPSTRLVLQAQSIISDSEDSRGYLSEGEQYRRSRFPRVSKSGSEYSYRTCSNPPNFMIRISPIASNSRDKKISHNCSKHVNQDANSKKRSGRFHNVSAKEFGHDTTSESEISDFEKSCPFYFSNLHQDQKKKHVSRRNHEYKSHGKGIITLVKNLIYFKKQKIIYK